MKIAVTSQNRHTVTGHAGKCRRFWIFEVDDCEIKDKQLLELAIEQSFHATRAGVPHPLDAVNVLITAGMGTGLLQRLRRKGIMAVATAEAEPDRAVAAWLNGTLKEVPPDCHHDGQGPHKHRHPALIHANHDK